MTLKISLVASILIATACADLLSPETAQDEARCMRNNPSIPQVPGIWKQCAGRREDAKDYGIIQTCTFVKKRDDSYLRVFYGGTLRIYNCDTCCKRWFFTFNGVECNPAIDGVVYMWIGRGTEDLHRHRHIEGYCGNIAKGVVTVAFNVGNCQHYGNADAYTGWNSISRIVIEEVPLPS